MHKRDYDSNQYQCWGQWAVHLQMQLCSILFPGYNYAVCIFAEYTVQYEHEVLICAGHDPYTLQCDSSNILYINTVRLGHSPSYSTSPTIQCSSGVPACDMDDTQSDIYRATSYTSYSGITVPTFRLISCPGIQPTPASANYYFIRYACLPREYNYIQATGLDAWASRVKCPARFVSHLHDICIYMSCL